MLFWYNLSIMQRLKNIFRQLWKHKWLTAIALVIVLGLIGFAIARSGQPQPTYTTESVKRGTLEQTVSATGAVEPAQDIELTFRVGGRLTELVAKEGQKVTAGTVLARLDARSLSAQIAQQQASVAAAVADLQRVQAGASTQDVAVTREQLSKAQNDLVSIESERLVQIRSARQRLVEALVSASANQQAAFDVIFQNFVDPDNATISNHLEVEPERLLTDVQRDYYTINRSRRELTPRVTALTSETSNDVIFAVAESLRLELLSTSQLMQRSFTVANAIEINSWYTQATVDALKTSFTTQNTSLSGSLSSLQTAKANLTDTITNSDTQVQSAQNAINVAQAQLQLKQAGPRNFELAAAQASVAQARARLAQVLAEAADYTITAPIDGTVTRVNADIGEQVSVTAPLITMLGTEAYQIKVDIAESDISKVSVGDKTTIELDAFGADQVFNGTVTFIDPAQTVIQDVIYYKTTVSFDDSSLNEQIKPGMTADVTLATDKKDDVLYIPQRAVRVGEATLDSTPEKYVEVLVNGKPERRTVTVGLRADGGLVEILSGVTDGEQVITFTKQPGA